ncbi:uncharacterized protein M421DRAFT_2455 [Didymella exigua CBS 183.55]|uniref:Uncharacterized protein n=1 Tax=Didymella exigua CBS 183.55 TaxID=1150837 RepID=A0A6A5RVE1_9PLEO|nr:uncharacterized protein M421DRAFT_2455 [Didymella exigua CBS 183.55]KAF1931832.1 hypothetical protein M421DRAFT_2455 [Didymella exigua CBS 183.55]
MWSLIIVQTIDSSRGQRVLKTLDSTLDVSGPSWTHFITAATQGIARMWILIVASLITIFTVVTVIMSNRYYWLRISPPGALLLIETASVTFTITAFACALSLSLTLEAFNARPWPAIYFTDLSFFSTLIPLSKCLIIVASTSLGLLLTTLVAHLTSFLRHRAKAKDIRSFEPTVSALGMSHGFHALHPPPRTARAPIPTMYDPYRAFKKGPGVQRQGSLPDFLAPPPDLRSGTLRLGSSRGDVASKRVGFTDEGAWMARTSDSRWSVSTASPRRIEGDIMRLLEVRKSKDVKKSRRAVSVRPASVVWYGTEIVHAL